MGEKRRVPAFDEEEPAFTREEILRAREEARS